jgi:hypothetical protein
MLEVVLTYRPATGSGETTVSLAKTADRQLVAAVANEVIATAEREALLFDRVCPEVAEMRRADVARIEAILNIGGAHGRSAKRVKGT